MIAASHRPPPRERIRTVRELIAHVEHAARRTERPLPEYLRALWHLGAERHRAGRAYLTPAELGDLLVAAFEAPAPPFDPSWRLLRDQTVDTMVDGFTTWEATVRDQILDLDELVLAGLADASGSFFAVDADEVDAPGGGRWGNLAPGDFLAAAFVATFGAEPAGAAGGEAVDPGAGAADERPLGVIDWDRFAAFLAQGQRPRVRAREALSARRPVPAGS